MTRMPKFNYWRSADGDWRWHLRAGNGEIVAQGEGYRTKAGVLRGIAAVRRAATRAQERDITLRP